jgi:D-sedoheptulose 7-phosphate isomerase
VDAIRINELTEKYPVLAPCADSVAEAYRALEACFTSGGKLLTAGNGGSSADAGHIVGELMKEFTRKRPPLASFAEALGAVTPPAGGEALNAACVRYLRDSLQRGLPAIDLGAQTALITACVNDIGGEIIYAQQLFNYGSAGDVFIAISTSGNAKNLVHALLTARVKGITTIALLGGSGGIMKEYADIAITVPETETYKVQELHLPVYHTLCLMLEEHFFP